MNKTGIALAADSAVTVTTPGNKKIYNSANKIFTLSKYHPVAIMIYNSASFMTTPWETIVKLYRAQLGTRHLSTVHDYLYDFIHFLKRNNCFIDQETQMALYGSFLKFVLQDLKESVVKDPSLLEIEDSAEKNRKLVDLISTQVQNLLSVPIDPTTILPEFSDYTFESFHNCFWELTNHALEGVFGKISFPQEVIEMILKSIFNYFRSSSFFGNWSGLVFAGYGESEIFPSIVSLQIAESVDGKLRYFIDREQKIGMQCSGSIMPYAQRDVIDTIIAGIDPELDSTISKIFANLFKQYNGILHDLINEKEPEIALKIKNLDIEKIIQEFNKQIQTVKEHKLINPIVNTVSSLSKEDLAEMAESLIYLTFLKRRISSADESVGGPVDVAVISKGDGFIWIKRKHYFDPKLNQHFFNNYFKKPNHDVL